MALARARPVYGSPAAREALGATIRSLLTERRDPAKLRADVVEMRATMAAHKPPQGPLDIKLSRGGLVDLEFLIHFLQLRDGIGLEPDLATAVAELASAGLVTPDLAEAQATLTRFLVAARLLAPDFQLPPPAAREALARACACGDWDEVTAGLARARVAVAAAWQSAFGEDLEITA
jgi:glutamate-ammonia-ligase adenylyltransferase